MSINTHTQRAQKKYLFIASTQLLDTYKRFFFSTSEQKFCMKQNENTTTFNISKHNIILTRRVQYRK